MATPSSSATTPSPALSFAIPATVSERSVDDSIADAAERDEARRKILARADFAKLTRALRSSLSLASYKAKHNLIDVPLKTLEMQAANRARSRTLYPGPNITSSGNALGGDKKRKASGSIYYGSPAAPSNNAAAGFGSPRSTYNAGSPAIGSSSAIVNATHSLFTSILAPPSPKRARTIRNPLASPVAAPVFPTASNKATSSPKRGRTTKGAEKGKAKAKDKAKPKHQRGPSSTKAGGDAASSGARTHSPSSTHSRSSISLLTEGGDVEGKASNEVDIKAAATLTDILFSRPGASPRSSISAGSVSALEIGSPSQQYAQSSARTARHGSSLSQSSIISVPASRHARTQSASSVGTTLSAAAIDVPIQPAAEIRRSATPTLTSTPRANRVDDSEAADVMLLLANSPSPARPKLSARDVPRSALAGRVLFPTSPTSTNGGSVDDDRDKTPSKGAGGAMRTFATPLDSPRIQASLAAPVTVPGSPPREKREPVVTPPTPSRSALIAAPTQLLPAPPSPSIPSLTSGSSLGGSARSRGPQPLTPASSFDMSDYINVSPAHGSPMRTRETSALSRGTELGVAGVSGSGAGIGRRLFDGETGAAVVRKMRFGEADGGPLGSGIGPLQT